MTIVKKIIYYRARELIKYRKHLIILCPDLHQNIVNSYVVNNINVHACQHVYSTNHVYLHRPNAFRFWQMRLHLCYETLKRISNFSELA